MSTATISPDEFQALEARVHRAIEVVRQEREARSRAEAEVARLRDELDQLRHEHTEATGTAAAELDQLRNEREAVRQRVERMLSQMDELL